MSIFGPEYHKIDSVFKRDERKRFIVGDWADPEFEYLKDNPWRWTEKIDGTNVRLHWNGEQVRVGGRTDAAQIPTFLLAALDPFLDRGLWFDIFGPDPASVFGEGYGPKIQSGGDYADQAGLILFDVRVGDWWLRPDGVKDVAGKLGLPTVPELGVFTLAEAIDKVAGLDVQSEVAVRPRMAEGMVGTPLIDLFTRKGDRIIAKVKARDFAADRVAVPA